MENTEYKYKDTNVTLCRTIVKSTNLNKYLTKNNNTRRTDRTRLKIQPQKLGSLQVDLNVRRKK